jgi:hypothetical protein
MTYKHLILIISSCLILSSCSVTNNLYQHNANPYEAGEGQGYFGVSTGLKASIDSVSQDGEIHYTGKFNESLNINGGGGIGIGKNTNFNGAIHIPNFAGGFGLRAGVQHSLLPSGSTFNIALGIDLGFVASKDSVKIFGERVSTNSRTKGILNADFFVPISFNFTDDISLNFAARYSYNSFRIRLNENQKWSKGYNPKALILGANFKYKNFFLEVNTIEINTELYPVFGIGVMIN